VEAGADAIEVHLAVPDPFAEHAQMIFENVPLSAQILYRVRTSIGQPILAKVGMFRSPRLLHETATKLAPWANGFVLVHGALRRVVDEDGKAAFEGMGRDLADVVGADTFAVSARQVEEMLAWRKAGAWDRAIVGVGGITSTERALHLLHEGADAVLVATAALVDPLFASRFREASAQGAPVPLATNGANGAGRTRSGPPADDVRRQGSRSKPEVPRSAPKTRGAKASRPKRARSKHAVR
jgi:dihydroorotate dehydrogenase